MLRAAVIGSFVIDERAVIEAISVWCDWLQEPAADPAARRVGETIGLALSGLIPGQIQLAISTDSRGVPGDHDQRVILFTRSEMIRTRTKARKTRKLESFGYSGAEDVGLRRLVVIREADGIGFPAEYLHVRIYAVAVRTGRPFTERTRSGKRPE